MYYILFEALSNEKVKQKKSTCGPVDAMTSYKGTRGIAPLILNLGTRWRWGVWPVAISGHLTPIPIE